MLKGGSDSRYLLQADEVDWQSTRSEPLYHNSPVSLDDISELNIWCYSYGKVSR